MLCEIIIYTYILYTYTYIYAHIHICANVLNTYVALDFLVALNKKIKFKLNLRIYFI